MCKVSVILPSLNVRPYITECLESVTNQTVRDIEIICVDAGSTDGTLEIIKNKAASDTRIRVILSDKKSYGYQMNLGMAAAEGEYIGIVETDDYVPENMYEELYDIAAKNDLDFIKSDFYRFTTNGDVVDKMLNKVASDGYYDRLITPMDEKECFGFTINTWNGIYKTSFLRENEIQHNESPGASFQDNGFWFLTYIFAKRAWFHNKAYYMNRRDNPGSSVFDKSKSFCICDEYDYLDKIICALPDGFEKYKTVYAYGLFRAYYGNLSRVDEKHRQQFFWLFRDVINRLRDKNAFDRQLMGELYWNAMLMISDDYEGYYQKVYLPNKVFYEDVYSYDLVVIYGAGVVGKRTLDNLCNRDKTIKNICFAVTEPNDEESEYMGYKIVGIDSLVDHKDDALILVAVSVKKMDEMIDYAKKLGFKHVAAIPH